MCLCAGFAATRAVISAEPPDTGGIAPKSGPFATVSLSPAAETFDGPSWLRGALDKWREARAEALEGQSLTPNAAQDAIHPLLDGLRMSIPHSPKFDSATLERILPASIKGSMNDQIEFRTDSQGTFAAPWGTDPGPFE